jgi:integral membrane sensor domain MASE1
MRIRSTGRPVETMAGAGQAQAAHGRLAGSGLPAAGQPGAGARTGWTGLRGAAGALVLLVVIAAAHAAGTGIVSQLEWVSAPGEVFFPAAGVTVAALLLLPRRLWPLVLAVAFASELAADLLLGETITTAAGSAVAITAGPVVGVALLLAWAGGPPSLGGRRQLFAFVAGPAVIGAGVGALTGAAVIVLMRPHGSFVTLLARWWTSGALGVLIRGRAAAGLADRVRLAHPGPATGWWRPARWQLARGYWPGWPFGSGIRA